MGMSAPGRRGGNAAVCCDFWGPLPSPVLGGDLLTSLLLPLSWDLWRKPGQAEQRHVGQNPGVPP